jgi:hypothetical protein
MTTHRLLVVSSIVSVVILCINELHMSEYGGLRFIRSYIYARKTTQRGERENNDIESGRPHQ